MKECLKIYISGAIESDPLYGFHFWSAEMMIREGGDIPLNPADLPTGLSKAEYMRINFAMIDVADMVLLLDTAERSRGACLEKAYCEYIGKPVATVEEWRETNGRS